MGGIVEKKHGLIDGGVWMELLMKGRTGGSI
jgi:hypothetical protein